MHSQIYQIYFHQNCDGVNGWSVREMEKDKCCRKNRDTILSYTDPFSASHTHTCPDHAVALKHVLIHTQFKLRRKGKYVMVNKMKWRERTPVRAQYLHRRPLQCDAGSHFEHLHNCAVLYIQTDSIEYEPCADKLVTERNSRHDWLTWRADKWVSFTINVNKSLNLFTIVFDNTSIINELISNLEVTVFSALSIRYRQARIKLCHHSSNVLFHSEMHHLVLRATLCQLSSLYILVYFPVFSTSCSLIDSLLFVEPLQRIKERHVLVRCSATTGSRHVLATSSVPFSCHYVSVFMKWKGV